MSELLVTSPPAKKSYNITKDNARDLALRSHAARKAARELVSTLQHSATEVQSPGEPGPHARKVLRLERQIEAIDEAMEKAKTPADWRDLTNAKARLFEQWAHLAGIPKPGSRRPGREPQKRAPSVPLEPAPAAAPNPPPEPPASTQ